ncbi:MAG: flagellar export chaperone FliS [Marmoricola sp.]
MTTNARAAYLDASIATASPARLLVMLYDRLVLDVQRALEAQHRGDNEATHHQLVHAQEIVMELHGSLKPEAFKGGHDLAALYGFLHRQLVRANITKDAALTAHCLRIISDLAETWRQAALESVLPKGA